jgi:hypothetical protein
VDRGIDALDFRFCADSGFDDDFAADLDLSDGGGTYTLGVRICAWAEVAALRAATALSMTARPVPEEKWRVTPVQKSLDLRPQP